MDYSFFPTYYSILLFLKLLPIILFILLIILFILPIILIKIQLYYKADPPTKGKKNDDYNTQ